MEFNKSLAVYLQKPDLLNTQFRYFSIIKYLNYSELNQIP